MSHFVAFSAARPEMRQGLVGLVLAAAMLVCISGCDAILPMQREVDVAELARTWPRYQAPIAVPPLQPQRVMSTIQPPNDVHSSATPSDRQVRRSAVQPPVQPTGEWDLPQTAIDSLGRIGAAAVPGLLRTLQHSDPRLRAQATRALARIGPDAQQAVPHLIAALEDVDPDVQKGAARALGQIGPAAQEAVVPLLDAIEQSNRSVPNGG